MEITNEEQLKAYLESRDKDLGNIELIQLTGGSANFVWRMTDRFSTRIIKHAEPYVAASNGRMPFPVDRIEFEKSALEKLPTQLTLNTNVNTPTVFEYDPSVHVLIMSDGGQRTLKTAYSDLALDITEIGFKLGEWLARLHQQMTSFDIGDNKTAKAMYRYAYSNLGSVLENHGLDAQFGNRINEKYGALLQTDDNTVCHGDFWPGNILLNEEKRMNVVDWEMVRRGCGATDVGQFAAEAYLLDRFTGGRGLLPAFLSGYRENGTISGTFLQRVCIHMGVHLAFWSTRVLWGSEEETKGCVMTGYRLLRQADIDKSDRRWIHDSLLAGLE